ncbi:hypothetical protein [Aquilutibacter rugosus]|uniref:hypothetical protein n=1 Tax=Aquilutibacter rugosus TaxID=3115820 RepID=UPI002F42E80A
MKSDSAAIRNRGIAGLLIAVSFMASSLTAQERMIIKEHVSTEWADVLRVTPIYQKVTGSRWEQVCEDDKQQAETTSLRERWLDRLRSLGKEDHDTRTRDRLTGKGCRLVRVEREFRRPIAYDVDYAFRGMKFRTRMPEDPGSRLRIRVGVKPIIE